MEIDRNAPATKGDLVDLEAHLQGGLVDLEARLKGGLVDLEARFDERIEMLRTEVQHGYNDLRETLRDSQTELLKAFYSFGQSNSKRFAELEGNEAAIRSRLGTIEDRLMELERRVITPPPQ